MAKKKRPITSYTDIEGTKITGHHRAICFLVCLLAELGVPREALVSFLQRVRLTKKTVDHLEAVLSGQPPPPPEEIAALARHYRAEGLEQSAKSAERTYKLRVANWERRYNTIEAMPGGIPLLAVMRARFGEYTAWSAFLSDQADILEELGSWQVNHVLNTWLKSITALKDLNTDIRGIRSRLNRSDRKRARRHYDFITWLGGTDFAVAQALQQAKRTPMPARWVPGADIPVPAEGAQVAVPAPYVPCNEVVREVLEELSRGGPPDELGDYPTAVLNNAAEKARAFIESLGLPADYLEHLKQDPREMLDIVMMLGSWGDVSEVKRCVAALQDDDMVMWNMFWRTKRDHEKAHAWWFDAVGKLQPRGWVLPEDEKLDG